MIPERYITEWSEQAPWVVNKFIEQDLIVCRALVSIYSDAFLAEHLAFRGGTALGKLFLKPQPLPSAHRPLSAGGADALAEGHRLVPQHHAHLPEQTTQGDYIRKDIKPNSLPIILLAQKMLK